MNVSGDYTYSLHNVLYIKGPSSTCSDEKSTKKVPIYYLALGIRIFFTQKSETILVCMKRKTMTFKIMRDFLQCNAPLNL